MNEAQSERNDVIPERRGGDERKFEKRIACAEFELETVGKSHAKLRFRLFAIRRPSANSLGLLVFSSPLIDGKDVLLPKALDNSLAAASTCCEKVGKDGAAQRSAAQRRRQCRR